MMRAERLARRLFRSLLLLPVMLCAACHDVSAESRPGDAVHVATDASPRLEVVGYLPSYRLNAVRGEQLRGVDRILYFGLEPAADGTLPEPVVADDVLLRLRQLQAESGAALVLCVGGWEKSAEFMAACRTTESRRRFLRPMAALCEDGLFSGVDFDWEYPKTPEERAAYTRLLRDASAMLAPCGGSVSVAVAPWQDLGSDAFAAVDCVHLMSYDHAHPQATYAKSIADLETLAGHGVAAGETLLGLPFYGRDASREARSAADLLSAEPALTGDLSTGGFSLNNAETLRQKVRLAADRGLAGVMIWELGQDIDGERSLLWAVLRERDRLAAVPPRRTQDGG